MKLRMKEERCDLKKVVVFTMVHFLYVNGAEKLTEMIYILSWTPTFPIDNLELEGKAFYDRKCFHQNCYITNDSAYLNDIKDFDAIIFNVVNLQARLDDLKIPKDRSRLQNYIFFAQESPEFYPLYDDYDDFFNLTWTYKLDSSIVMPFLHVMDKNGQQIGPNTTLRWMKYKLMKPVGKKVRRKFKNKMVAAAWFVSSCYSENKRYEFAQQLQYELNKYEHRVDIYGDCGFLQCPKNKTKECNATIESDYYFYLAFEKSFAEDYVTDQLLHAVENFAVPVVYGSANYSRFLPPRSYLDGRALGAPKLAKKMANIIKKPVQYYNYFRWQKYYSFRSSANGTFTAELCDVCAVLNERRNSKKKSVFPDVVNWWNGKYNANYKLVKDKLLSSSTEAPIESVS